MQTRKCGCFDAIDVMQYSEAVQGGRKEGSYCTIIRVMPGTRSVPWRWGLGSKWDYCGG